MKSVNNFPRFSFSFPSSISFSVSFSLRISLSKLILFDKHRSDQSTKGSRLYKIKRRKNHSHSIHMFTIQNLFLALCGQRAKIQWAYCPFTKRATCSPFFSFLYIRLFSFSPRSTSNVLWTSLKCVVELICWCVCHTAYTHTHSSKRASCSAGAYWEIKTYKIQMLPSLFVK